MQKLTKLYMHMRATCISSSPVPHALSSTTDGLATLAGYAWQQYPACPHCRTRRQPTAAPRRLRGCLDINGEAGGDRQREYHDEYRQRKDLWRRTDIRIIQGCGLVAIVFHEVGVSVALQQQTQNSSVALQCSPWLVSSGLGRAG